ncbi:MAG TPA: hypothetical protein VD887_05180 [Allosphingosinicella sp.]|nr:hypothetical protein [Allosphingosinicella sp.]
MASRIALIALALFAAVPAAAQERLDPEEEAGLLTDYEAHIRLVLADAFAPPVRLRAIVLHSFQTEYAVGLREGPGGYEIFSLRPARQIWTYTMIEMMRQGAVRASDLQGRDITASEIERQAEGLPADPADLPLARCSVAVDDALAGALLAAWRVMLLEVRPRRAPIDGLDGVTYRFSTESDGRMLSGQTWSPRENTRPARLARIAEVMRSHCERPNPAYVALMRRLADRLVRPAARRRPSLR